MKARQGALLLWNAVAEEGVMEFREWHGREHIPERVSLPGFQRARRFGALDGSPTFFSLYAADGVEAFFSPEYKRASEQPLTPAMEAAVRHLRHDARWVGTTVASAGHGEGGVVATFRHVVPTSEVERHVDHVARTILEPVAASTGVACCFLIRAEEPVPSSEESSFVLTVEAWAEASALRALGDWIVSERKLGAVQTPVVWSTYRLECAFAKR